MRFSIQIMMARESSRVPMKLVADTALEMAKMADSSGFDIVFTGEHHTIESAIAPNPFVILAAWAQHLKSARVGTAVVVAPYWHPIRLAGEAALTDVLTEGRLELGLGRGAYQHEFDRMAGGMPEFEGGKYLREAIPAIRALWAGDYEMNTDLWQFPSSTSVPKPVRPEGVPLWVAARSQETFEYAVENDCNLMVNPLSLPIDEIRRLRGLRDDAVAKFEKEANPPRFMLTRPVSVFETDAAREAAVGAIQREVRIFANLFGNLGDVQDGFPGEAPDAAVKSAKSLDPEAIIDSNLMGSPDRIVDELKEYEKAGVEEYLYPVSPAMPYQASLESLRLFIDKVMPAF